MIEINKNIKSKIILRDESLYITDLLNSLNVPECVEQTNLNEFITEERKKQAIEYVPNLTDIEERLSTIKNKMKTKRRHISDRSLKKREKRKVRKNKEYNKVMLAHTAFLNNGIEPNSAGIKNVKRIKPMPSFNTDGKIVFSKFDFAIQGAKVNGTKKNKGLGVNNPHEALNDIKKLNEKLRDLSGQGEDKEIIEMSTDLSWKKAFNKISGKKVKDDSKLLQKSIKRRKGKKIKSKQRWVERIKKVEQAIDNKQKKRMENINKKLRTKQNKKLKSLSKKGRIIPGF